MGILDSPDPIFETHADIPGRLTSLADSQKVGAREFNNLRTFANEVKALVMDAAKGNTALDTRATAVEARATAVEGRATALEGRATTVEGRATALEKRSAGFVNVSEYGTGAAALVAALDSGADIVDAGGATYTITSAVTVPAGVTLRNFDIVLGTPGMNGILVNTGCKLFGKVTGTGTTSIIERAIYPAADGVSDVTLDVEVSNITVGVHAQPLTSLVPKRWRGKVYVHDIVGTTGTSEGYGVLLSPAESCQIEVVAKDIKRHAVYLSAGARYNKIDADVDGCGNVAVQLFSTETQPVTQQNTVRAKVRGVYVPAGQGPNQAVGVYLLSGASYNTIVLDMDGEGTAEGAVTLEGSGGAGMPLPTGNKIVLCNLSGEFIGPNVIREVNGLANVITANSIKASAASAIVSLTRTGTPTIPTGATGSQVYGNTLDGEGAAIHGIYTEATDLPAFIGPNDVRNLTGSRVSLGAGAKRTGHSREFSGRVVISAVAANTPGSAAVTFPDDLVNPRVTATVSSSTVTGVGYFPAHVGELTATGGVVTAFNGCGDAQDITVDWVARGD